MSFDVYEDAVDFGEPINLFQFKYGPGEDDAHRYTDAEADQTVFGKLFKAIPIARSDINSSGTTDKTTMTVEMAQTEAVPELFRVYPPSYTVGLIIWQGHLADGDKDFRVAWSGVCLSCTREGSVKAKLVCEPLSVSLQRVGLRRNYQYMCPHVLYGPQCRANKAAATVLSAVAGVLGRFVTLTTVLGNPTHYGGGILEWVNTAGQIEYRTILSVDTADGGNSRLLLSGVPVGMPPGTVLSVSKGCPHTVDACASIHNNVANYGGQPFIPTKNPLGRATPFL